MGCSESQFELEAELLNLKLKRQVIQDQKKQLAKEYEELTGTRLDRQKVPDYVDIAKMKEREKNRSK